MATNRTDLVARIKADLIARGVIPVPQATNEHSAAITIRVAWALRADGAMLIMKTAAQNGAVVHGLKVSHDAIAFPAGWKDCLRSAGPPANANEPCWDPTGISGAPLIAPFDLDADVVPPVDPPLDPPSDPPVDPPVVPPGDPVLAALAALEAAIAALHQLAQDVQQVGEQVTSCRAEVLTLSLKLDRITAAKGFRGTGEGALYGKTTITLTPIP